MAITDARQQILHHGHGGEENHSSPLNRSAANSRLGAEGSLFGLRFRSLATTSLQALFQYRFIFAGLSQLRFAMSTSMSIAAPAALQKPFTPWLQRRTLKVVPLTTKVVRYQAGHGPDSHVTIQWCKGLHAKDTTTRTISPLTKPMCLTKEEVRGQKVEREITLPQGSACLKLIPGGVFDSQELLRSGEFKYLNWDKRKTYNIHGVACLALQTDVTITAMEADGISEESAKGAVESLIRPANFVGTPGRSSSSEMFWSTFQESLGLSIGGSFFYMGLSGAEAFAFSSDKYRYLYAYAFDQVFLTATADQPSHPADLFHDPETLDENALFLQEVKYGRRAYVLIESEYALERDFNGIRAGLEWIILSAKLQHPTFATKASKHIRIRIQTQEGRSHAITDFSQLQSSIDNYFKSSCADHPIFPLAYKVSDLDGTPVSLLTTAFLEGQHCLTSPKARVQLKQIKICELENSHTTSGEEIYGSVILHLYDESGAEIYRNGQSIDALRGLAHTPPASTMTIARKETPLKLIEGEPQAFGINEQEKYIDVDITSLDMIFQVEPMIKEKFDAGDNVFSTNTELKKNLRQMLIEGSTGTTFQCRHDKCLLELTVDIRPL